MARLRHLNVILANESPLLPAADVDDSEDGRHTCAAMVRIKTFPSVLPKGRPRDQWRSVVPEELALH